MAEQTIDLHINPSEDLPTFRIPVMPDVDGPPLPRFLLGGSNRFSHRASGS